MARSAAPLGTDEQRRHAEAIDAALVAHYGAPLFEPGEEPLEMLLGTILSANTNDTNSGRAFDQLKALAEGDWDSIRTMPLQPIIDAIRPAGMYHQKAPHIVGTLEQLKSTRGGYALDDLATMPLDEAMALLTSLPGVGHKTASIVLLFCFNRPAFPVDTHIQRISQRTGLAAPRATPAAIKALWESLLPGERYYALHLNLIRLGREVCRAQAPRCGVCPIQPHCAYGRA
jgi:endonuclease-3